MKLDDKPLISIIIPVTNMAGRLNNLRKLVHAAKNLNVELVIVHDISDLQTGLDLAKIATQSDPGNLFLLEGKFGSPGMARNAGFSKASGHWIWFCDSDDEPLLNNVFSELRSVEEKLKAEVVVFNFLRVNEVSKEVKENLENPDLHSLALNPGIWRILIKREVIVGTLFSNYLLGEDQLFLIESRILQCNIHFSNVIAYKYYFGGEGHLVDRRDKVQDLVQVFKRTVKIAAISQSKNSEVIGLMALRQFITLIKIGTIREKLITMRIAHEFIKLEPKTIGSLFKIVHIFCLRILSS